MHKKHLFFFLTSTVLFFVDHFYYNFWLPLLGIFWHLEALLRGVYLSTGSFYGRPIFHIHPRAHVFLGCSFSFISSSRRCSSGSLYSPVRLSARSSTSVIILGRNVGLNGTSIVSRSHKIYIGNDTIIAPNCVIMDSPFHRTWPPHDRISYNSSDLDDDVYIGDDCWIGTGSMVLPGAHVGHGSVVAARSVVRGSYPPNSLIAGVPSRLVRNLSNEEI